MSSLHGPCGHQRKKKPTGDCRYLPEYVQVREEILGKGNKLWLRKRLVEVFEGNAAAAARFVREEPWQ